MLWNLFGVSEANPLYFLKLAKWPAFMNLFSKRQVCLLLFQSNWLCKEWAKAWWNKRTDYFRAIAWGKTRHFPWMRKFLEGLLTFCNNLCWIETPCYWLFCVVFSRIICLTESCEHGISKVPMTVTMVEMACLSTINMSCQQGRSKGICHKLAFILEVVYNDDI